jgi:hypothetical protein
MHIIKLNICPLYANMFFCHIIHLIWINVIMHLPKASGWTSLQGLPIQIKGLNRKWPVPYYTKLELVNFVWNRLVSYGTGQFHIKKNACRPMRWQKNPQTLLKNKQLKKNKTLVINILLYISFSIILLFNITINCILRNGPTSLDFIW